MQRGSSHAVSGPLLKKADTWWLPCLLRAIGQSRERWEWLILRQQMQIYNFVSYCEFRKRLTALAPYMFTFLHSYLWSCHQCRKLIQPVTFDTVSCVIATLFHLHVMYVFWLYTEILKLPFLYSYILITNRKRSNISHAGFQKAVQKPETAASTDDWQLDHVFSEPW